MFEFQHPDGLEKTVTHRMSIGSVNEGNLNLFILLIFLAIRKKDAIGKHNDNVIIYKYYKTRSDTDDKVNIGQKYEFHHDLIPNLIGACQRF